MAQAQAPFIRQYLRIHKGKGRSKLGALSPEGDGLGGDVDRRNFHPNPGLGEDLLDVRVAGSKDVLVLGLLDLDGDSLVGLDLCQRANGVRVAEQMVD